jgi:Xaa-Pro aminopeptidase
MEVRNTGFEMLKPGTSIGHASRTMTDVIDEDFPGEEYVRSGHVLGRDCAEPNVNEAFP